MKSYKITVEPRAEADLNRLYDYISTESGFDIADSYVDRIHDAFSALKTFPHRGRQRDDVLPGLRTLGFERRVLIVFQIKKSVVDIKRILYSGQNTEMILKGIAVN